MKIARIFAVIFGVLGLVLMLGTAALCFSSIDAPVRAEVPRQVRDCGDELVALLNEGELNNLPGKLYGRPHLGTDGPMTGEAAAVWEIFQDGISCELVSDYYVSGSSFAVEAVITVPDIESISDTVTEHARAMLDEKIAVAEKMAELYDESGEFRQDLIDEIMAQAVALSFAEEPETLTFETTIGFVYESNQWYAVPDQAFYRALAGGLA